MTITIVSPARAHRAYEIAADTFASLAEQVAGVCVKRISDEDYLSQDPSGEFTVLIGNDAVNDVAAKLYLEKRIDGFGIRYGTDDYCIRTAQIDGKQLLFLAGGRPRAAIYAVYRYFERFCGCRYFWDGDRIPQAELPQSGIDMTESPRFDYRGIRYFAHRSLHRFQAEHWSFADWATEIDWVLKKRLNLIMLRIGMDDIFQKAFPDIVPYPQRDEKLPGTGAGYNERTLFWSLEYRGELRKQILEYMFARDLMHPEDCGTMTHWYSRTPIEFLDRVNPVMLPQSNKHYNDPTGRVWDIRHRENFDNYMKLTETHIREYGKPDLFHTIGLGERMYSTDREENQRMKLYVYRKIASYLKEHYPNAPLLIASWDLWIYFTPEEVRELVAELDPNQSIIFDYTSDTTRDNNFTNWGIVNKFPWVFGIFSGYEANSEIRGLYELTNERLKLAKDDPMCKGAILWPELSHGDPFVIEYFAQNAWAHDTKSIAEQIDQYAADRYPSALTQKMAEIWHSFMPIVQLSAWSIDNANYNSATDIFFRLTQRAGFKKDTAELYQKKTLQPAALKDTAAEILTQLAMISTTDEMTVRDLYDIARTIIGRYINAAIWQAEYLYAMNASVEALEPVMNLGEALMETLIDLLGSHSDYSLLASLEQLKTVTDTNPAFETTLKENASNYYCRSYIYEDAAYLYLPELRLLFAEVKKSTKNNTPLDKQAIDEGVAEILAHFFAVPLAEMQKPPQSYAEVVRRAAALIKSYTI